MKERHKKEETKLNIVFKEAKGVSEEEMQRRMNTAFDILFDGLTKNKSE